MRRFLECVVVVIALAGIGLSQSGVAPANYYPQGYGGDTFTGKVTQVNGDQITLSYEKGSQKQEFTGYVLAPCAVPRADGSKQGMPVSDIPLGTVLTAYYSGEMFKKEDGTKEKRNTVFAVTFVEFNGKKIKERNQSMYFCAPQSPLQFKYFGVH